MAPLLCPGKPLIKDLTETPGSDGTSKVLICEAEGAPEPIVQWSVNGTNVSLSAFSTGTSADLLLLTRCHDIEGCLKLKFFHLKADFTL